MKHGYDIREHVYYPGRYYIARYGSALPPEGRKTFRRLSLRTAQKRVEQLIKKEEKDAKAR